jgi:ABC-type antimicrobial peptide transport system permease subunit
MDLKDIFWLSYNDLSEKRVRTALTIIMVIIGVAAIVALTSFTAGISQSITSQLESLGPTSIIVSSVSSTGFTPTAVSMISSLPNVTSITPLLTGSAMLYAGNQNTSVTVVGTSTQGIEQLIGNVSLYQGSVYQDTIAPDAVVGHSVAFPTSAEGAQTITVGQSATLRLEGRGATTATVPVLGILPAIGGLVIPIDTAVFVSLQAAEVLLHRTSFNEILVHASSIGSVNATASQITTIYGSSARVITTAQLTSTASSIIGSITLLFGVIAGISLLVAAIGIMNIMLMSVMERTREIGIMKSIGFKSRHVMLIFMLQALIIGVLGGITGIGVGAATSYSLAAAFGGGTSRTSATTASASSSSSFRSGGGAGFTARSGSGPEGAPSGGAAVSTTSASSISFKPAFPLSTIISALLIAIFVSLAAGIYPAWRASQMEPIEALRQL